MNPVPIFIFEKRYNCHAQIDVAFIDGFFVGSVKVHLSYCGWSGPTTKTIWGTLSTSCCETYEELRDNLYREMYRGLVREFCSKNSCKPKNAIMDIQAIMKAIEKDITYFNYRKIAKVEPQFIAHIIQ